MFIKTQKFKSLLKEAYKEKSLVLYRPEKKTLVIITGYSIYNILIDEMTAPEKAAVIEFAGEFPEIGEAFKCGDTGNQMILEETMDKSICNLDNRWDFGSEDYEQTYVLVDTGSSAIRAVQNTKTNEVIWFQDRLINIIHHGSMTASETNPEHFRVNGPMYLMRNNIMTLAVLKFDIKNPELNTLLGNMELYGKLTRTDDSGQSGAEAD